MIFNGFIEREGYAIEGSKLLLNSVSVFGGMTPQTIICYFPLPFPSLLQKEKNIIMETPFKREQSKSSFTDDEELSRMSDLESEYRENANTSRRMSLASLPASPSASSYNKMSIDSDDARSTSSASGKLATEPRSIRPLGSHWATISDMKQQSTLSQYNIRQQDELFIQETNNCNIKKSPQIKAYDLLERRDPERRNVNRRSSLLVTKHYFVFLCTWIDSFY